MFFGITKPCQRCKVAPEEKQVRSDELNVSPLDIADKVNI
jgi:hypothetical protein